MNSSCLNQAPNSWVIGIVRKRKFLQTCKLEKRFDLYNCLSSDIMTQISYSYVKLRWSVWVYFTFITRMCTILLVTIKVYDVPRYHLVGFANLRIQTYGCQYDIDHIFEQQADCAVVLFILGSFTNHTNHLIWIDLNWRISGFEQFYIHDCIHDCFNKMTVIQIGL